MRHVVCSLDDLPAGTMLAATIDRVRIVVARTPDGEVHALRDACSHYGARLSLGTIKQLVVGGDVGEYELEPGCWVVQCPWHGYEFDLATGRCPADPERARVRVYRVTVEDGAVVVER